jgi:hypothetical protein
VLIIIISKVSLVFLWRKIVKMKRKLLISIILVLSSYFGFSCGMCNCYLSVEPGYNNDMVGLRIRHEGFHGEHDHSHGSSAHQEDLHEYFNTYEVYTRWYPLDKLQVLATLPYANNYNSINGTRSDQITGVGDLMMLGSYQLFNSFPNENKSVRHRVLVGAGVKLPTGKYNIATDGEVDELHQPGTGSTDLIAGTNYFAKKGKSGLHVYSTYKYNTINKNDYRFADRFNVNCNYLYELTKKDWSFYPNTGLYYETAKADEQNGQPVDDTGGQAFFANMGIDIFYKKFSLNLNGQFPLSQNLYGNQPQNLHRFLVGINYLLN